MVRRPRGPRQARGRRDRGPRVAAEAFPGQLCVYVVDDSAAEQINKLERQVFEPTANLNNTKGELQAARHINRELMQQANRSDHIPRQRRLRELSQPVTVRLHQMSRIQVCLTGAAPKRPGQKPWTPPSSPI